MSKPSISSQRRLSRVDGQRGVVMIITLITLVLLMLAGIAVFRSSDTASTIAAQMAFRRDLKNEAERGIARAVAQLNSGDLSTREARQDDAASVNYSATMLETNAQGLPAVLMLGEDEFQSAGMEADAIEDTITGVTIRTVIDRMCSDAGEETSAHCTQMLVDCAGSGGQDQSRMQSGTKSVYQCVATGYRISVRVDGPRSTQAFFQSVVAR